MVTITPGSAVDRLAEMIAKHNDHHQIQILPFHPKRYSQVDLQNAEYWLKWADLIDFGYWRCAVVLSEKFPWIKEKPIVLTHHNPYDIFEHDWNKLGVKVNIVNNETQLNEFKTKYKNVQLARLCVDLDFHTFNEDYDYNGRTVGMVGFRIEDHKGFKEVAQVCHKLRYKFLLVGHISKPAYFDEVKNAAGDMFEFREDVSDEELKQAYRDMSIVVCNSVNNFETGPMPPMEAMASGVPVVSRDVGTMTDIYNGTNIYMRIGEKEDIDDLEFTIKTVMEDNELKKSLRESACSSIRNYSDYRRASIYDKIWCSLQDENKPLVSIITPTFNREKLIPIIAESLSKQSYKNFEWIVCDDGSIDGTEETTKSLREKYKFPIKYVNTDKTEGYNLAMARNLGIIAAAGDIIVFLDSRFSVEYDAIEKLVMPVDNDKIWVFGDKGSGKNKFVENFSAVLRTAVIRGGMFNERISEYGGMSQEVRERFLSQDFRFVYIPDARVKEIASSKKTGDRKASIIRMKNLLWKIGYQ